MSKATRDEREIYQRSCCLSGPADFEATYSESESQVTGERRLILKWTIIGGLLKQTVYTFELDESEQRALLATLTKPKGEVGNAATD